MEPIENNIIDDMSEKLLEMEIEFLKKAIQYFMDDNLFHKVEKTAKELQEKISKLNKIRQNNKKQVFSITISFTDRL